MKKIRHIFIGTALILVFASIIIVTLMPLLAQIQFDSARKLISRYLWQSAEKKLGLAGRMDSFDSRYPAALGEFLFTQSSYKDNKTPLLKEAAKYYERAACLNPRCAEYYVKLGQMYVSLAVEGQGSGGKGQVKAYTENAFENFKKAVENDPKGFNTAYAVGYSGLAVWKELKEGGRAVVIDRLKYALKQKPWYSQYVYPRLLQETKNAGLLEKIMPDPDLKKWVSPEKIESLKKDPPKAWQGTASGSEDIYKDGNMYWSGTMYRAILLPEGPARIIVGAGGSPAGGVYPCMLVSLDGKKIGFVYVDSPGPEEYVFSVNTAGGVKILGITFTNDGCNDNEDRNLLIGDARVEKI